MIRLQLKIKSKHTESDIKNAILKELRGITEDFSFETVKRSLDARDKSNIYWLYTIDVDLKKSFLEDKCIKTSKGKITRSQKNVYVFQPSGTIKPKHRPVVVGSGPAGLFAAYMLAINGYSPIVLERGEDVDSRQRSVEAFWNGGELKVNSNVQFGEGGAGTFSDGKLNTGVKDPSGRIGFVLDTFVKFGADPEIRYSNKPHIGTDILKKVVKNMRNEAIRHGAEFHFNSCVTDVEYDGRDLKSLTVNKEQIIPCDICVLAIGHSSRDTFSMLTQKDLSMSAKAFAIGLRIEHLQKTVGFSQYGE